MGKEVKVLGLFLLGIFMISLLGGVVVADKKVTVETTKTTITWTSLKEQVKEGGIVDPVYQMFMGWNKGELSNTFAKWLLLLIMILVLYAIFEKIPMIKDVSDTIKWILAAVMGFLSIAYLSPAELQGALMSYSAMGFILSLVVPFIIMIFVSKTIQEEGGAGGKIIVKLIWGLFVIFLIYKSLNGMFNSPEGIDGEVFFMYLVGILVIIFYIWKFEKVLLRKFFKAEITSAIDQNKKEHLAELVSELAIYEDKMAENEVNSSRWNTMNVMRKRLESNIKQLKKEM